jgi:8-oxo-dGTP pyrophosphatase MutT (NUDIX family)
MMPSVQPRPAATVVVVRATGTERDLEFLMLRRAGISRFAPGFVVFPGGVVDPGDRSLARAWFGDPEDEARACALRELAEEAGLVMSHGGLVEAPGHLPGEPSYPPPDPKLVPEISRWVAPEFLPVRFDARFFAVEAGPGLTPRPDGLEIETAWWGRAADVLAGLETGEVQLLWPTFHTLKALAECRSVGEVLELRMEAVPPPVTLG